MVHAASLAAEWERIDLLVACATLTRRGDVLPDGLKARLQAVQERVQSLRQHEPWLAMSATQGLSALDQEILACALAPVAEPRLGWLFQDLQGSLAATYPTPALIQELYFLGAQEAPALYERLSSRAPLVRGGLLEPVPADPFAPVRPSPRARSALLGWSAAIADPPPGSIEVTAPGDWSDLVLPEYCFRALREFTYWTRHREQVFGQWGGQSIGGPLALFTGPSGTGKTFSAIVLANALGWPIYRVDVGLLVSKWVGETEKNFNALFDAAHGRPMVLLFDEAESLFGKRADIRDARDRFANMEISHLLSRIERHEGPCILTSNLREHLDPAFARRFTIVVEFPRPDAAARADLWRRHLPPKAPYDDEVGAELLGQSLSLTGGQIRNAALHAAFLAAGGDQPIGLRHLARAVWVELAKEGREVMPSSLSYLAKHLEAGHRDAVH